jgi:hypothetical protein
MERIMFYWIIIVTGVYESDAWGHAYLIYAQA